jgi:hypothetical protein
VFDPVFLKAPQVGLEPTTLCAGRDAKRGRTIASPSVATEKRVGKGDNRNEIARANRNAGATSIYDEASFATITALARSIRNCAPDGAIEVELGSAGKLLFLTVPTFNGDMIGMVTRHWGVTNCVVMPTESVSDVARVVRVGVQVGRAKVADESRVFAIGRRMSRAAFVTLLMAISGGRAQEWGTEEVSGS